MNLSPRFALDTLFVIGGAFLAVSTDIQMAGMTLLVALDDGETKTYALG